MKLQWSAISVKLNELDGPSLMRMIIERWVTIRGFSFAGAYIEIYSKKSLQKSKGLRTKLCSSKKGKKKMKQLHSIGALTLSYCVLRFTTIIMLYDQLAIILWTT